MKIPYYSQTAWDHEVSGIRMYFKKERNMKYTLKSLLRFLNGGHTVGVVVGTKKKQQKQDSQNPPPESTPSEALRAVMHSSNHSPKEKVSEYR